MGIRTDLALEKREMHSEEIEGVRSEEAESEGLKITRVFITDESAAKKIGKPIGTYVTVELEDMEFENEEIISKGSKAVAHELKKMIKNDTSSVLVAGLGNRSITPDSVGPKAVDKVFVTRHLSEIKGDFDFDFRPVSAVAPGVLGITGIETGEILSGIAGKIKPDLIICVDALASRSLKRLGTTVQISDSGINPGSGVGNNRREISEKTFSLPVIAIGVPMVVDAATVAEDILKTAGNENPDLIKNSLEGKSENMIVTPSNVDIISDQAADIISEAINIALHGEDILNGKTS